MRIVVHYTVNPDQAEENIRLIKAMCDEFNKKQYSGLRYAAFVGDDGVTFFHLPFILGDDDPLPKSQGFKAFKKDISDRYAETLVYAMLSEVGSYNFHRRETSP